MGTQARDGMGLPRGPLVNTLGLRIDWLKRMKEAMNYLHQLVQSYMLSVSFVSLALSLDELMETPMASLKSCRNAKVTKLNEVCLIALYLCIQCTLSRSIIISQVYDLCLTPDDIAKAEKFLIA